MHWEYCLERTRGMRKISTYLKRAVDEPAELPVGAGFDGMRLWIPTDIHS
jgi:hypothetical protein